MLSAGGSEHLFKGLLVTNTVGLPYYKGSGYFVAPCYFAIWRQYSPNGYFAASAKIALSLMLTLTPTQTLALILTLIPTLALTC